MRSDISRLIKEVQQSIDIYEDVYPELQLMHRVLTALKELKN